MTIQSSFLRRFSTVFHAVISLMLAIHITSPAAAEDQIKLGKELFTHKWVANDKLSPGGDGLGPMHNADSCIACHHLGGIGGAGSFEENVELLSIFFPGEKRTEGQKATIRAKARRSYPTLFGLTSAASSVVLHKFNTDPGYESWRASVQGFKLPADLQSKQAAVTFRAIRRKQSSQTPVKDLPRKAGVPLQISQRNTPALFGAGLIDSIPEKTLVELAQRQAQQFPGINGRLPRTPGGKVGRFGWRGQVSTLREFVLSACATELGLQNPDHPQAGNPLSPDRKLTGNDLTAAQCDALIAFIAALPAPRQLSPANQQQANLLNHGERLFETIGCIGCHVRDVGNVQGIFSDLLLHDLGPNLDDPVAAFPERVKVGTTTFEGGYGGGGSVDVFAEIPTRIHQEWKTPPLWGVRDSGPYLHDGRARTLTEAISAHGGEAESSARRFEQLGDPEKSAILTFLQSLASPEVK